MQDPSQGLTFCQAQGHKVTATVLSGDPICWSTKVQRCPSTRPGVGNGNGAATSPCPVARDLGMGSGWRPSWCWPIPILSHIAISLGSLFLFQMRDVEHLRDALNYFLTPLIGINFQSPVLVAKESKWASRPMPAGDPPWGHLNRPLQTPQKS